MILKRRVGVIFLAPTLVIILLVFVGPLLYFLKFSLDLPSTKDFSTPALQFGNYADFFNDPFYMRTLAETAAIAAASTILALIMGLPAAYFIATSGKRLKIVLLALTVFPMLVGTLVRSIGWSAILGYGGVLNAALQSVGITRAPVNIMQTHVAVTLVIATIVLPVMILILNASMESLDPATTRAALDLGSPPLAAFLRVVVPQIAPGIVAGTSLVMVLCINAYSTPILIGGSKVPMFAPELYATVTIDNEWPFGATMAVILLATTMAIIAIYASLMRRQYQRWVTVSP